jgi:hypothetical protein
VEFIHQVISPTHWALCGTAAAHLSVPCNPESTYHAPILASQEQLALIGWNKQLNVEPSQREVYSSNNLPCSLIIIWHWDCSCQCARPWGLWWINYSNRQVCCV